MSARPPLPPGVFMGTSYEHYRPRPAFCHRCGTETPGMILPLRGGPANVCASCRTCRRLPNAKPYLSKLDLQSLTPNRAQGEAVETVHA